MRLPCGLDIEETGHIVRICLKKNSQKWKFFNWKFKKTISLVLISYTPHGQIWLGASDRTQSDNIWLDRVSVCTCIYFPCVTSDHTQSWDCATPWRRGRPHHCAQALTAQVACLSFSPSSTLGSFVLKMFYIHFWVIIFLHLQNFLKLFYIVFLT